MKYCDYCGRENADDALSCRECGTQEFKEPPKVTPGLGHKPGASEEADAVEEPMNSDLPDVYECLGTYPPYDARSLLEAFLDAGVRYTLDQGKSRGDQATALGASYGGAGGVTIGVHKEDLERATSIRTRVLKIQV